MGFITMDLLLQEIAKTFNITNESISLIIQNYPELKQQYITIYYPSNPYKFIWVFSFFNICSSYFNFLFMDFN